MKGKLGLTNFPHPFVIVAKFFSELSISGEVNFLCLRRRKTQISCWTYVNWQKEGLLEKNLLWRSDT